MLRDIGKGLIEHFAGNAYNIVREANGHLFGSQGLDALLNRFKAYSEDPLRKKANILTHELIKERISNFHDIDKIQPAIEYHILRLYERTGRVVARSEELQKTLLLGKPLTDWFVKNLRECVSEALLYTSGVSRISVPDVNYVEWQIARHICLTNQPRCIKHRTAPKELPGDIKNIFQGSCPYTGFCVAYSNHTFLKLKEPIPRRTKSFY